MKRSDAGLFNLFDQAMDLEEDSRESFLVDLARTSPNTALKIRRLVQDYEGYRSFFEHPWPLIGHTSSTR